jgi:hypothetical protein
MGWRWRLVVERFDLDLYFLSKRLVIIRGMRLMKRRHFLRMVTDEEKVWAVRPS